MIEDSVGIAEIAAGREAIGDNTTAQPCPAGREQPPR